MENFILEDEGGISSGAISVRLAFTDEEIKAAQHLRYKVFYEEYGAEPLGDMAQLQRDYDDFDDVADHLIVIDTRIENLPDRIVGTYRLLRQDVAKAHGGFYTKDEYDIAPLEKTCKNMLELGRSCTHKDYRTRPVMQLLWQAIAEYITYHGNDIMFGCASFHGTDLDEMAQGLSYLYHHHLAPEDLCPVALPDLGQEMNLLPEGSYDPKAAFKNLPALIKGYLRLGGYIGRGAVIDKQFNTIDVCIVVKTDRVSNRYRKHYERKGNADLTLKTSPAGQGARQDAEQGEGDADNKGLSGHG